MKPQSPSNISVHAQEDGTVLLVITVNQAVQWIPRGPGEPGSALRPLESPTKALKFILPAYDAETIGNDLVRASGQSVDNARMASFNSKASELNLEVWGPGEY